MGRLDVNMSDVGADADCNAGVAADVAEYLMVAFGPLTQGNSKDV
jgi:hypothetical protein